MGCVVRPLLNWYAKHARILPWREDATPYRVWVSEIMLQQTRVSAAYDYFIRFVKELPDVYALAEVPAERLMKLWEGLGYYNRARNMQKAAQHIVEQYDGEFPERYEQWLALPGVGSYTAGAVLSIAFGQPCPAVDGNVLRVLARLRADRSDVMLPETKKEAEALLKCIMPEGETSAFTQALMELGAMVCIPNGQPLCEKCPLVQLCEAYKQGVQEQLPVKAKKKQRKLEQRTVLLLVQGKKLALRKRAAKGLLAGLWELPSMDGFVDKQAVEVWLEENGLKPQKIKALESAKHVFTHVEWHMCAYEVQVEDTGVGEQLVWADAQQLAEAFSVPSAFKKYVQWFLQQFG